MRLAIDAMGNDNGPGPIAQGVVLFLQRHPDATVVLVGQRDRVEDALVKAGATDRSRIEVVHASQVVEMDDKVRTLKEKRDSSIMRCMDVISEGQADALVALGNTAATVGAACMRWRFLPKVRRAGIATPLPTVAGTPCVALDMGANTAPKPQHLFDYGVMASIYAERVLHINNPRIGLLNVGEEVGKGNDLLREAYAMMQDSGLNFIGNVEGGDIYAGTCDVVVCDGFVGNVVLKASEGVASMFKAWLSEAFHSSVWAKLGGLLARPALKRMLKRGSYDTYGGAPLLGVNGICIIGHGRSNAEAVASALRVASESAAVGLNQLIRERLEAEAASVATGDSCMQDS